MWFQNMVQSGFLSPLYNLFYNILIGFTDLFPGASIVLAVIALTLIVKIIIIPLTYRSIRNQIEQKKLQPLQQAIREKYKDDKQKQSQELMNLYKEHKTNPLSGCFLAIIQALIIIPLYYVFLDFAIVPERLYSFISAPETINTMFLGFDLAQSNNIIFAVLTGLSQFVQFHFSPAMQDVASVKKDAPQDAQTAMMQSMGKSMKFTMPLFIGFIAYVVPTAVAVYWIVSNLFTIAQELVIRKKLAKEEQTVKAVPLS